MRIGWIKGCEIRLHPMFCLLVAAAAVSGQMAALTIPFSAILYHEIMHALAAAMMGYPVTLLELLPFGSTARIEGLYEEAPHAELLIALAGPASNVLMVMALTTVEAYTGLAFPGQEAFVQANLQLALFNLLPFLPMDGGRVLRSLLAGFISLGKATRLAAVMGVIGGILMAAAALLGYLGAARRFPMTLLAITVVLSALKAGREAQWLWLRELTGKKNHLMREKTLPIRHIAADGDMMLGQLVSRFLPHRYHMVTVLDEVCRPIATLSENEVVEALMKKGAHTRIFAILSAKG